MRIVSTLNVDTAMSDHGRSMLVKPKRPTKTGNVILAAVGTLAHVGLAIAALPLVGAMPFAQSAVQCEAPLSERALTELVGAGVPAARLRQWLACGIESSAPDAGTLERQLTQLGLPAAALTALAPPANVAAGSRWRSPIDGREMILISSGTANIGSELPEPGRDSDESQHAVSISGFWMDVAEVTNEAYRRFVLSRPEWQKGGTAASNSATYLKHWNGNEYPTGSGDHPVVYVTWRAAQAYAAWAGKRLPTEVEWEYAARAGITTRYWWGSVFEPSRLGGPTDSPNVMSRTNPWGLLDTLGSVWEWTSSSYRPYPYKADDGREIATAEAKVVRGGSRSNGQNFVRSANRSYEEIASANDLLGFRCAR